MICKDLKSNISIKHIPVILFSAIHGLELIYKDCDATDFIAKPVNLEDLIKTLQKNLKAA